MKARKNNITFIVALVAALTLMVAATAAASTSNVGYETFKDTMKNINHEGGGSGTVKLTVTDNGQEIFSVDAEGVGDKNEENFSAEALVSDGRTEKAFEIFGLDSTVYVIDVDEDGYYQMIHDDEMDDYHRKGRDRDEDHEITAVEEELMDYFLGDLKDNFAVTEENDGSKTLSFSMEESEVPTGLNLMIKAASAADHRTEDMQEGRVDDMPFLEGLSIDGKPDIVEDAALKSVAVSLEVNADDQVEAINFELVMTGLDADGNYHEIAVTMEASMDYSDAEPAGIDPSQYDWETLEQEEHRQRR